jgi:predicted amidohydrolase YtcJ
VCSGHTTITRCSPAAPRCGRRADRSTPDPAGGVIGRADDGEPTGVLFEEAAGLVAVHVPAITVAELETDLVAVARDLLALGVVAVHDPGGLVPEPDLDWSFPAYVHLSDAGRLPVRTHVSMRDDAPLRRSNVACGVAPARRAPEARARVGWPGRLPTARWPRTAALLEEIEVEPGSTASARTTTGCLGQSRRSWQSSPNARAGGIATQIHAIGDAAVRTALEVLAPTAPRVPLMPRLEHVQLVDPADRASFVAAGIAASVQPVHLGSDAAQARLLWGARAERNGYTGVDRSTGAVMPFGTDAPVELLRSAAGIALAVRREDPRWPAGTAPYGPHEALSLDRALRAACVDPAVAAREPDRGRLTVGQRADIAVIPAAAIREPVEPGGPLATVRPTLVVMDGRVVFEA